MGTNVCCQDYSVSRSALDKIQSEITVPIASREYYIHEWPIDEATQLKINDLKEQEEFKELFTTHKMMKHKYYDKYYVGQWNENGFPEGRGVLLVPDSFIYHGQFHNVPNGEGVVELFREKIKYQGELKEGKAEGNGKITSADGRYAFQGIMADSAPRSGLITLLNTHDESKSYKITLNNFPEGRSEIQYGDGRRYYGFINKRSFAPEGQGVATFPDGSKYEGSWQEGEMHGQGTFSWKDGSSYKGEYQHGRKHGLGTFVFPSRKYYEGEWVHGRQNGKGGLYDQNGQTLQNGLWKDGVFVKENE